METSELTSIDQKIREKQWKTTESRWLINVYHHFPIFTFFFSLGTALGGARILQPRSLPWRSLHGTRWAKWRCISPSPESPRCTHTHTYIYNNNINNNIIIYIYILYSISNYPSLLYAYKSLTHTHMHIHTVYCMHIYYIYICIY